MEEKTIDKDMEVLLRTLLNEEEFPIMKKVIESQGHLNLEAVSSVQD